MDILLHSKQRQILDFIRLYYRKQQYAPTMREISKETGITLSVVKYHLKQLVRLGLIKSNPHTARGLVLVEPESQEEPVAKKKIPLLGVIAAGKPLPDPVGPPDEYIEVDTPLLPARYDNLYALRVQGDSMIDALIQHGDYAILRYQETANPGDMVAAWIPGLEAATLKYYYPDGAKVHLVSDNIRVEPIVVDAADLQIKGVVSFFLPGSTLPPGNGQRN